MIELMEEPGEAWDACESALDARRTPLPLFHRAIWARALKVSGARCLFISIRDADGICRAGFAVESRPSRSLPGHRLLNIVRFGAGSGGLDEPALEAGLAELAAYIRKDRSVLRITVEVFALDPECRARTSEALHRHGFLHVQASRSYERTLLMDLAPPEDVLLAGFHRNARQRIRSVRRLPVELTTAESVFLAPRLQDLDDATRQRTGGELRQLDWESFIRMSAEVPHLSRIAILRRTDRDGPESVLAFAWGCRHGDVGQYFESGSVRADDMRVPTGYALLWDLISWARLRGAHWFDLGGITAGGVDSDDALGGISDFKRRFSQREIEVGEQWQLEPRPVRAAAARVISGSASLLRQAASRIRSREQ